MTAKRYHVAGIGNAIVDVFARVDEHALEGLGVRKGVMTLVDRARAEALQHKLEAVTLAPGGSVANTIAGVGALGLTTAFVGRVRDDALGRFFAEDTARTGTAFVNPPVADAELPTSRSIVLVTPDGERSMCTYLGISAEFGPDDVDTAVMAETAFLFLEGYLFDKGAGKEAFLKAARACRKAGGRVGLSLSDPICVDRHRHDFRRLIADEVDFVIGNQAEWMALYQANDLADALGQAVRACELVVATRSGEPVVVLHDGLRHEFPVRTTTPVDATGAGDQFAAGFLYGLATGRSVETAARMGILAAEEVIGHLGARPKSDVRALFRAAGLI